MPPLRLARQIGLVLRPKHSICLDHPHLYGGFAGEPLDDDSREYIFVARR